MIVHLVEFKSYEIYIMVSVAILGLLIWIFHFFAVAGGELNLPQKVDNLNLLTAKQVLKPK